MKTEDFLKEIEQCSLDDLKTIFETQKDLYSSEEMEIIHQRIQAIELEEKEKTKAWIAEHIPKEIICPKCDGPNPFENDHCCFCGHFLDKKKYFELDYYTSQEETDDEEDNTDTQEDGQSYTFQFVVSFLIPLVGFILGAILLGKDCDEEKSAGKTCIILGIVSILVNAVLIGVLF